VKYSDCKKWADASIVCQDSTLPVAIARGRVSFEAPTREVPMLPDSPSFPRRTLPIVLGTILAAVSASQAQVHMLPAARTSTPAGEETKPQDKQGLPKLTVGECLKIAMEKQPKLAAFRASVGSADASLTAQEHPNVIVWLTPDHKFRKSQAAVGVQAAQAELDQATHDVTQAVVWTFYSVVYARQQLKVAADAVAFVDYYREIVQKIVDLKQGSAEINNVTLNHLIARLAEGELLKVRAQSGYERAKAALREAMGVEHTYYFEPADEVLPDFADFEIKKEDVIGHARTRRGEVLMASLASDVTRLEAYAQWSIRFRFRVETFASGGDIHARHIPAGSKEGEYRPDAIGPEMPVTLFGDRASRSQKSWELVARSQAVLEKTTNLVTLEAEDAWIEYYHAGLAMTAAKKQATAGQKNLEILRETFGDKIDKRATLQGFLEAQEEAAKGQAAFNEAVYHRISAMANIERITAGGIKMKYPGR
jgi:outer membrane protein TolC